MLHHNNSYLFFFSFPLENNLYKNLNQVFVRSEWSNPAAGLITAAPENIPTPLRSVGESQHHTSEVNNFLLQKVQVSAPRLSHYSRLKLRELLF